MARPVYRAPARELLLALGAFLFLGRAVCVAEGEAAVAGELTAPATNLLAVVAQRYEAITNLSCSVRRQVAGGGEELVSRVVFAHDGRLNAETLSPEPRQTVVDGTFAWTKGDKDRKPRRVAFDDQSPAQKASVLCVPASPEDALRPLDPASGADLPSPAAPYARQVVFRLLDAKPDAPGRALVSLDEAGRIRSVELFADTDFRWRLATYSWSAPSEVLPGVWLFGRSSTETAVNGAPVVLTTRFDNLRVNQAIDPDLFDADKVFGAKNKR